MLLWLTLFLFCFLISKIWKSELDTDTCGRSSLDQIKTLQAFSVAPAHEQSDLMPAYLLAYKQIDILCKK